VYELISQARNQLTFNQITDQTVSFVKHVKNSSIHQSSKCHWTDHCSIQPNN